jgi:hypothetical protein
VPGGRDFAAELLSLAEGIRQPRNRSGEMKDMERENVRLKRLVADLSLEKQVVKDVASRNLYAPCATRDLPELLSTIGLSNPDAWPAGRSGCDQTGEPI